MNSFSVENLNSVLSRIWFLEHELFQFVKDHKDKESLGKQIVKSLVNEDNAESLMKEITKEEFTEYQKQTTNIKELDQLFY